jgi:hypothetical protein
MEYLVGLLLAVGVAAFARVVGFDRERAFYGVIAIVVATYYILFAVMGGSGWVISEEIAAASIFCVLAVLGFLRWPLLLAVAIAGHGVFDAVHHLFITNTGMPAWWPGFCGSFDVALGLLVLLRLRPRQPST